MEEPTGSKKTFELLRWEWWFYAFLTCPHRGTRCFSDRERCAVFGGAYSSLR
jgi:hypothetical protein